MKVVSIVGRPNVGKSTLFNKIAKQRISIVEMIPGVTRDRIEKEITWKNKKFILVDTGGMDFSNPRLGEPCINSPNILKLIHQQINKAIDMSDVIIFLVDGKVGLAQDDIEIAKRLRKTGKKIIPVVNKVDNEKIEMKSLEFYKLGFNELYNISALQGKGISNLLDKVCEYIPEEAEECQTDSIKIAIIGRPNVGKSSIINSILGEERQIVDASPGTTRDSVDIKFSVNSQNITLIDTAGIRKKAKIKEKIEYYSVVRAQKSIERCNIVVLVIDAVEGVVQQDKKIAGIAKEEGKGMIILVNKWDLVMGAKKEPGQKKIIHDWISAIKREFYFSSWAPIIFTSAKTQHRIAEIIPTALSVFQNYTRKIDTPSLNKVIQKIISKVPPSTYMKDFKVYYAVQKDIMPPTFIFFVSNPDEIKENYVAYLEKKIRSNFSFAGVPIRIIFKEK